MLAFTGCGEPCGGLCDKATSCGLTDCEITSCPSDPALEECLVKCYQAASCTEVRETFFGGPASSITACAQRC